MIQPARVAFTLFLLALLSSGSLPPVQAQSADVLGQSVPLPAAPQAPPNPLPGTGFEPADRLARDEVHPRIGQVNRELGDGYTLVNPIVDTFNGLPRQPLVLYTDGMGPNILDNTTDKYDLDLRRGGFGEWQVMGDAAWGTRAGAAWTGKSGHTVAGADGRYAGGVDSLLVTPELDLKTGFADPEIASLDLGCHGAVVEEICLDSFSGIWNTIFATHLVGVLKTPLASCFLDPTYVQCAPATNDPTTGPPVALRPEGSPFKLTFLARYNLAQGQTATPRDGVSLMVFNWTTPGERAEAAKLMGLGPGQCSQAPVNGSCTPVFLPFESGPNPFSDANSIIDGAQLTLSGGGRPTPSYRQAQALDGASGFTGNSNGWRLYTVDLTRWAGQSVWLGFHFASLPTLGDTYFQESKNFDQDVGFYGFHLDDLRLTAPGAVESLRVRPLAEPSALPAGATIPTLAPTQPVRVVGDVVNTGMKNMTVDAHLEVMDRASGDILHQVNYTGKQMGPAGILHIDEAFGLFPVGNYAATLSATRTRAAVDGLPDAVARRVPEQDNDADHGDEIQTLDFDIAAIASLGAGNLTRSHATVPMGQSILFTWPVTSSSNTNQTVQAQACAIDMRSVNGPFARCDTAGLFDRKTPALQKVNLTPGQSHTFTWTFLSPDQPGQFRLFARMGNYDLSQDAPLFPRPTLLGLEQGCITTPVFSCRQVSLGFGVGRSPPPLLEQQFDACPSTGATGIAAVPAAPTNPNWFADASGATNNVRSTWLTLDKTTDGWNCGSFGGRTVFYEGIQDSAGAMATDLVLPEPLRGAAAVADGRFGYLFGGSDGAAATARILKLDMETGKILQSGDLDPSTTPASTMPELPSARFGASAALVNGTIYVFGGTDGTTPTSQILGFNPATNTIVPLAATLPSARHDTAAVAIDGSAYVLGGIVGGAASDEVVRFDPPTGQVYRSGDGGVLASLPAPRSGATIALPGGVPHLVGGSNGAIPVGNILRFDPFNPMDEMFEFGHIYTAIPPASPALKNPGGAAFCYANTDGVAGYSAGDAVFLQVGGCASPGTAPIAVGAIRIANPLNGAVGSRVFAGDPDTALAGTLSPVGSVGRIGFVDGDGDTFFRAGNDTLYAAKTCTPGSCGTVSANDIILSGPKAGKMVAGAPDGQGSALRPGDGTFVYFDVDGNSAYGVNDFLFLDGLGADSQDWVVSVGDVQLSGVFDVALGAAVAYDGTGIYYLGGVGSNLIQRYSLETRTFTTGPATLPAGTTVAYPAALADPSGGFYLLGGVEGAGASDRVVRYEPGITSTCTPSPCPPFSYGGDSASLYSPAFRVPAGLRDPYLVIEHQFANDVTITDSLGSTSHGDINFGPGTMQINSVGRVAVQVLSPDGSNLPNDPDTNPDWVDVGTINPDASHVGDRDLGQHYPGEEDIGIRNPAVAPGGFRPGNTDSRNPTRLCRDVEILDCGFWWPTGVQPLYRPAGESTAVGGTFTGSPWMTSTFPLFGTHRQRGDVAAPIDLDQLAGKDIRLKFAFWQSRPPTAIPDLHPLPIRDYGWRIGGITVAEGKQFQSDLAVAAVEAQTTLYDAAKLGLGPDSTLPVRVVVENRGLAELHRIRLNLTGTDISGVVPATLCSVQPPAFAAPLAPGARLNVTLGCKLPAATESPHPLLSVQVSAHANEEDDFPSNNVRSLPLPLAVEARSNLALKMQATPRTAPVGAPRDLLVVAENRGNVPIHQFNVTLDVFQDTDGFPSAQPQQVWRVQGPLATDGTRLPALPVGAAFSLANLQDLRVTDAQGRPLSAADLRFTPATQGAYVVVAKADLADLDPADNLARASLAAQLVVYGNAFDQPPSPDPNPVVAGPLDAILGAGWNVTGGSHDSSRYLAVGDPAAVEIPAGTDAMVYLPPMDLTPLRGATLTFNHRYDLETSFDGARVEVSTDGGATWRPLRPTPNPLGGLPDGYPSDPMLGSGPLLGDQPVQRAAAYTGASAALPQNDGGWVPAAFDLSGDPELRRSTAVEDFSLAGLEPFPTVNPTTVGGTTQFSHPSWELKEADAQSRQRHWWIENLTRAVPAGQQAWWSGSIGPQRASSTAIVDNRLTVSTRAAAPLPPLRDDLPSHGQVLILSWWDWRAGAGDGNQSVRAGTGGDFTASLAIDGGPPATVVPRVAAVDGNGWTKREVDVTRFAGKPATLTLSYLSNAARRDDVHHWATQQNNLGWFVRPDVEVTGYRVSQAQLLPPILKDRFDPQPLASPADFDIATQAVWQSPAWALVGQGAGARGGGWHIETEEIPGLGPTPAWRFSDPGSPKGYPIGAESRLVTPLVDLGSFDGQSARLAFSHRYGFDALLKCRFLSEPGSAHCKGDNGQYLSAIDGGAVEFQVFDPVTQSFGPWRQLGRNFRDFPGPLWVSAKEWPDNQFTSSDWKGREGSSPGNCPAVNEVRIPYTDDGNNAPGDEWRTPNPGAPICWLRRGAQLADLQDGDVPNRGILAHTGYPAVEERGIDFQSPYPTVKPSNLFPPLTRNSIGHGTSFEPFPGKLQATWDFGRNDRSGGPVDGARVVRTPNWENSPVSYVFSGASEWDRAAWDITPLIGQKVRFAFHAASAPTVPADGRDPLYGWGVAGVAIESDVFTGKEVQLRFHVATDGSATHGEWGIDDVAVVGVPYAKNLAVTLDPETPRVGAPGQVVHLRGRVANLGTAPQHDLALAVGVGDATGPYDVTVATAPARGPLSGASLGGMQGAGPFKLTEHGGLQDTLAFDISFQLPADPTTVRVRVQVLQAQGKTATVDGQKVPVYEVPAENEAKGSTYVDWAIRNQDVLDLVPTPPVAGRGDLVVATPAAAADPVLRRGEPILVRAALRNNGTVEPTVTARWTVQEVLSKGSTQPGDATREALGGDAKSIPPQPLGWIAQGATLNASATFTPTQSGLYRIRVEFSTDADPGQFTNPVPLSRALEVLVAGDSAVATLPVRLPAPLSHARSTVDGDFAYVFGGTDGATATRGIVKFNTVTGQVVARSGEPDPSLRGTTLPELPRPLYGADARLLADGNGVFAIYLFGGTDGTSASDRILRFDPETNTLAEVPARLPTPRFDATMMRVDMRPTLAYIMGGIVDGNATDEIVKFDAATNRVLKSGDPDGTQAVPRLPSPRSGSRFIFHPGSNAFLLVGGENGETPVGDILRFDPSLPPGRQFTLLNTIPAPTVGAVVTSDGDDLYILGGRNAKGATTRILRYNFASDSFAPDPASLPSPVSHGVSAIGPANRNLYLLGGTDGAAASDRIVSYTLAFLPRDQGQYYKVDFAKEGGLAGWIPGTRPSLQGIDPSIGFRRSAGQLIWGVDADQQLQGQNYCSFGGCNTTMNSGSNFVGLEGWADSPLIDLTRVPQGAALATLRHGHDFTDGDGARLEVIPYVTPIVGNEPEPAFGFCQADSAIDRSAGTVPVSFAVSALSPSDYGTSALSIQGISQNGIPNLRHPLHPSVAGSDPILGGPPEQGQTTYFDLSRGVSTCPDAAGNTVTASMANHTVQLRLHAGTRPGVDDAPQVEIGKGADGKSIFMRGDALSLRDGKRGWQVDRISVSSTAVEVTPAAQDYPIQQGANKTFVARLRNIGQVADAFRLSFQPPLGSPLQAAWVRFPEPFVTLGPGESRNVPFTVGLPGSAKISSGRFAAPIAIQSLTNPDAADVLQATLVLGRNTLPDLVVGGLSVQQCDKDNRCTGTGILEAGRPVTVSTTIRNLGITASPALPAVLLATDPLDPAAGSLQVGSHALRPLCAAQMAGCGVQEAQVTFSFDWTPRSLGSVNLTVRVNPGGVPEIRSDNNERHVKVTVVPPGVPDVAVTALTIDGVGADGFVEAGSLLTVRANVTNLGGAEARNVRVRIQADASTQAERTISLLAPGQTIQVTAPVPDPEGQFILKAFSPFADRNTENNALTRTVRVRAHDLRLTPAPANLSLAPGGLATALVEIENRGGTPERVSLAANATAAGWGFSVSPNPTTVPPKGRALVVLTVQAPADAVAGMHAVQVAALPLGNPLARRATTLNVTVGALGTSPLATATGLEAQPGVVEVPVLLSSRRNAPETLTVALVAPPWAFQAGHAALPAGGNRSATVRVEIPPSTPTGLHPLVLEVRNATGHPVGQAATTVTVLPRPAVQAQWQGGTRVASGDAGLQRFLLNLEFNNTGNVPLRLSAAPRELGRGLSASTQEAAAPLAPGESMVLPFKVDVSSEAAGSPLYGVVDVRMAPAQDNATPLAVLAASLPLPGRLDAPDLAIKRVDILPRGAVKVGEVVRLTAVVENQGTQDAPATRLRAFVDSDLLDEVEVPAIPAGRQATVNLTMAFTQDGGHLVVLQADGENLIQEMQKDNNGVSQALTVEPSPLAGLRETAPAPGLALLGVLAAGAALARRRGGRRE